MGEGEEEAREERGERADGLYGLLDFAARSRNPLDFSSHSARTQASAVLPPRALPASASVDNSYPSSYVSTRTKGHPRQQTRRSAGIGNYASKSSARARAREF